MHLLRLLMSCRDLLRTGTLIVDVGDQREPLLAVKRGEVPWTQVESWMARLATEAEEAAHRSPLPPEPDRARVEDFVVRTRRASALQTVSALQTASDLQTVSAHQAASGLQAVQTDPDDEVVQGIVRGRVLRQH